MFGLETISPKFRVQSSRIKVLYEPKEFYAHLCDRILSAKSRVFLASLYIGKSEREFVNVISEALRKNSKLKVYVLVDALRGTREAPHTCSASLLSPLAASFPDQVQLAMYKTPKLNWITSKLLPKRIIEGVGLQHMKLYGFDDEIVLSGANLSKDYFTNRQDRYICIKDKEVCNWFFNVHSQVSSLSWKLLPARNEQEFTLEPPARTRVYQARSNLKKLILPTQTSANTASLLGEVTEIYPVCQFTPLGFGNEHQAMINITKQLSSGAYNWLFTAGYFNVEPEIGANLACAKNGQIILAAPEANGFYGSKGLSGSIPRFYTLLASKFLNSVPPGNNISVREWKNGVVNTPLGWSYHAKGLWLSKDHKPPLMTYIGSSNFTRRTYQHDLECGAFLVATTPLDVGPPSPNPDCISGLEAGQVNNSEKTHSISKQLAKETENLLSHCGPPIASESYPSPRQSMWEKALLSMLGDRL